jgi:undecaprenyl-diphosphatase
MGGFYLSIIESIILGIIQGLTEFLPVSSSGHIVIAEQLLKIDASALENDLFYTVLLHLGTLVAVIIAFRKTILALIKDFFALVSLIAKGEFRRSKATPMQKMIGCLIVSLFPLLIVFPFSDKIDAVFSGLFPVGMALLINSIILFFADRIAAGKVTSKNMNAKQALWVGIVQCIAIIPGISRSGSTVTAGLAAGLSRKYAAKYSFILSIPTILGGAVLSTVKLFTSQAQISSTLILPYVAGFIAAAITGFIAIRLLEFLLKKRKFIIFSVYCLVAGTACVIGGLIA